MNVSDNKLNRHEKIAHFYAGNLNDQNQNMLIALEFTNYKEVLTWLVQEFYSKDLNWSTTEDKEVHNNNSPYSVGLPNVVRIAEEEAGTTLEQLLTEKWESLTSEQRNLVIQNFKNVFGYPYLQQGINTKYCKEKYRKWISLNLK